MLACVYVLTDLPSGDAVASRTLFQKTISFPPPLPSSQFLFVLHFTLFKKERKKRRKEHRSGLEAAVHIE